MESDCSSCGNTFEAEGETNTFCSDCAGENEPFVQEAPILDIDLPAPEPQGMEQRGVCVGFSELEKALFGDSEGAKTASRFMARMRVEGYQEDAWKVIIGLTAYAYKNYNCSGMSLGEMRTMLAKAPLRDVADYIPGNIEEVQDNISSGLYGSEESGNQIVSNDVYKMGGLVALALAFAFATRSR